MQDKINILQESINLQSTAINDLETKLKELESSIKTREVLIRERVKVTMIYTIPDRLSFLKAVNNYDDFMRGEAIVYHVLRNDLRLYKLYSKELSEINELRVLIDSERVKMVANQESLKQNFEKLKETIEQKKRIIVETRTDRKKYAAYVNHFNKGSKEINEYVSRNLNRIRIAGSPLIKSFYPPVKEVKIIKPYGKIRDLASKSYENNRGITAELPYGTDVYSVSNGVVRFSGWILGYGKVLIIEHPNGVFSIYGHLAKIMFNLGDKVARGASVALSGDSGAIETPAIYFELKFRDKSIDPTSLFR